MDERFNTSHVTLYRLLPHHTLQQQHCFNTSHVTLYLSNHAGPKSSIALFQYISCYSLSKTRTISANPSGCFNTSHVTLYQCCYVRNLSYTLRFNTSHVTLYLMCRRWLFHFQHRFNTSHVTLYLNGSYSDNSSNVVSIHLMLLFIEFGNYLYNSINDKFQYISCYSLSK